jgi:antirestriction protein ArdC
VLIEGGEPVPVRYKDIIGFLSDPLPEYSLLAWLPSVEVEGEKKIDLVLKQLKAGVESIQDSYQFRLFLTTMSKFHDYSKGNMILIMLQKPNATRIAGFSTWKNLGRWVKKGEKGIAILAPCFPPKQVKPEPEEEETPEEEIEVNPIYFKVVHVFDVNQTEGKPLPEFEVVSLTGEANEDLFRKAMDLVIKQGLEVSFESRPYQDPAIKGSYSGKSIWVRPEESRAQQMKTLLHEIAHHFSESVFRIPRRDAETIAESAAFTVGAHFGFDSGVRSFAYVALWAEDKKILEQNLTAIRKVSSTIIETLESLTVGELIKQ